MAQQAPEQRPPGSDKKPPVPKPQQGWFWWVLFGILLIWNFIIFFGPRTGTPATIPYSTFVGQVRAGNISAVHIVGDQITGAFVKPFAEPVSEAKRVNGISSPAPVASPQPPTSSFQTTFPATVGDAALMQLLESHRVVVDVASPSIPWFLQLLASWLPALLLFGVFIWMLSAMGRGQAGLMSGFGRMRAKRYANTQEPVTFNDVAGADEAKAELQEEVDFLQHPQKYRNLGARIPRGVLLVGAPGTGKTLLARAIAGEAKVPFLSLNASEFVEMFVGVGASRVRDLFSQAKAAAPAIVFIDELDAVGRRRGAGIGTVNDEREQTLNQLLGELDGFDQRYDVIILAATNRPDVLDPALLRPGRFDRQVTIDLPDKPGREGILRIHTRKIKLAPDVDLAKLAAGAIGLSGADLANLSNEAALTAARRDHIAVTQADFEEAHDKIRLGAVHPHLVNPDERRTVAYHESGHALVAWLTPGADVVQKVTIVPRGRALGQTEQIPGEELHNLSRAYLNVKLAVLLGGRTAEEIALGDVSTGAENDLVEATSLARRMVTRWGMGEIGLLAFKTDEQQPFLGYEMAQGRDYSEATAARIDADVARLLDEAHDLVRRSLTEARDRLDALAQALLREETIGSDELQHILGPPVQRKPEIATAAHAFPASSS
ncbi:MAG TPA: ATP-dependent zinc metalloprotease FtsH [Candidatus Tyrphobacter sp.]